MYCSKCGTQNPDDGCFCSKCGNDLSKTNKEKTNVVQPPKRKITLGLVLRRILRIKEEETAENINVLKEGGAIILILLILLFIFVIIKGG